MPLQFSDLQEEVARRATRDQGGTTFTQAIKNTINLSLFRIAREALWRPLRRKSYITTKTSYTTGTASVTSAGTVVNVAGASFITDDVHVGRRVKISGDGNYRTIRQISGETSFVMDYAYGGTSGTATYEILPQSEYVLPIQCGHRVFLWHEEWGYPKPMEYVPEYDFINSGQFLTDKNIPQCYRMWGEDMTLKPISTPTTLNIVSSSGSDATQQVTVFGTVSGYPDYEVFSLNGTTNVVGTRTFSEIDRVVKNNSTAGRITVSASGNTSDVYSVIPARAATIYPTYSKVDIYPLPTSVFDINVYYYKEPYSLINAGDVHELGYQFDEAIILLSVAKIKGETNQTEAAVFYDLYKDELKTLRRTNADKIDFIPTLQPPHMSRNWSVGRTILQYRQAGSNFGPRSL